MQTASPGVASPAAGSAREGLPGYRHEAFLWQDLEQYVTTLGDFVRAGLEADEAVVLMLHPQRWGTLAAALGPDAERVTYLDMTRVGHNPARIVPAWLDALGRAQGRPTRGVDEALWPGRRTAEVAECHVHEAALNVAIPADTPLWLVCPYDVAALPPETVAQADHSHPRPEPGTTADRAAARHRRHLLREPLSPPGGTVEELAFAHGGLALVRRLTERHAAAAGLDRDRARRLTLAVNELAANSLDHGGGHGTVRAWCEPGVLVVEVRDSGLLADPLAGRIPPAPEQVRGRGLWMVQQLSDLVQVRVTSQGSVTRVLTWL